MRIPAIGLMIVGAALLIVGTLVFFRKPVKSKKRSIYDKPPPKINYRTRAIGFLVGFAILAIGIVVASRVGG